MLLSLDERCVSRRLMIVGNLSVVVCVQGLIEVSVWL